MRALVNGVPIASDIIAANSLVDRMRGLLGRESLPAGSAMLIDPCGSIHTFGMRFSIDAIFLDSRNRVTRVCRGISASRIVLGGSGARRVLELQAGSVDLSSVMPGCTIEFAD